MRNPFFACVFHAMQVGSQVLLARALGLEIPWSFFTVTPAAGQHFGLALNSSDDDAPGTALQQSMSSSVATRQLLDPTSWGTVQIDP